MKNSPLPVTKNCPELLALSVNTLLQPFLNSDDKDIARILHCFYNHFRNEFVNWSVISYKNHVSDNIRFLAENAFTDAVEYFSGEAKKGEITDRNTLIKTILRNIYWQKFRHHLQKETRQINYFEKYLKDVEGSATPEDDADRKEQNNALLDKSLALLDPEDQIIIRLRHLDLKSVDEIAAIYAISINSAYNKIYRSMQRLRAIMNKTPDDLV